MPKRSDAATGKPDPVVYASTKYPEDNGARQRLAAQKRDCTCGWASMIARPQDHDPGCPLRG